MFDVLIASGSRAAPRRRLRNGLVALSGHAAICAALVWATLPPTSISGAEPQPIVIAWPAPHTERRGPDTRATTRPGREVSVPTVPPIDFRLPPIDPLRLPGEGETPAPSEPLPAGPSPRDTFGPWTPALVEEPPVLLAGPSPHYPDALRAAGIEGRAVVEFVVDTLGRAEPGSATVVTSTHPAFADPARRYVVNALFRPGRVHGRAVRVLIRLPIEFRLSPAR